MTPTIILYIVFLTLVVISGLGCIILVAAKVIDVANRHWDKKDIAGSFPYTYDDKYYVDLSDIGKEKCCG